MIRSRPVLAALAPLAILGAGLAGLLHLGQLGGGPPSTHFAHELASGPVDVVVLGNSVTISAVDAGGLGGRGVLMAMQGAQPAHWLAMLRHRVAPAGQHPPVVLSYVPIRVLTRGRLVSERDRNYLVDLLSRPDPPLVAAALGEPGLGAATRLSRGRQRARSAVLAALRGPTLALFGRAAVEAQAQALAVVPADPDARFRTVPGEPTPGTDAQHEPDFLPPEASLLPALLAEAHALGALFVAVDPAVRPGEDWPRPCTWSAEDRAVVDTVLAGGGAVVDLRGLSLPEVEFRTRYHVDEAGKARITAELARILADGLAPGSTWCLPHDAR